MCITLLLFNVYIISDISISSMDGKRCWIYLTGSSINNLVKLVYVKHSEDAICNGCFWAYVHVLLSLM